MKFVVQNRNAVPKNIKILQDVARPKTGCQTVVHLLSSYVGQRGDMSAPAAVGRERVVFAGRNWVSLEGRGTG